MSACILFMLRSPRPGMVKTRLARDVGGEATLALYKAFVLDMLEALRGCGADVAVWVEPGGEVDAVREWLDGVADTVREQSGGSMVYLPQPDGDLGEKMDYAFRWAFGRGYAAAAALGSDMPQLSPKMARSLARLLNSEPALIGPCPDGGYWTIGFRSQSYLPEVFANMPWSTPELFTRTMAVVEGLQPAVLPELADTDTLDDLLRLALNCPAGLARRTLAVAGPLLRSFQGVR
jgi:hypothetical protein